jgi:hypothetical protein
MLKKRQLLFLVFLFCAMQVIGQNSRLNNYHNWLDSVLSTGQSSNDSLIKLRYINDTTALINFPNVVLFDSVLPEKGIKYWELNQFLSQQKCINLYKSSAGVNKSRNDTQVLIKAKSEFGTTCPPGWCTWYIAAKLKNGSIQTVKNRYNLGTFIGKIDNQFDAYLWLADYPRSDSKQTPLFISNFSKYKRIKEGYLIVINMQVSDCPITRADIFYLVHKNKHITYIQTLKVSNEGGCI